MQMLKKGDFCSKSRMNNKNNNYNNKWQPADSCLDIQI